MVENKKRLARGLGVLSLLLSLFASHVAFAAVTTSQTITLAPGWNIVSTPKVLNSHAFSAAETLTNFSIFTLDPSRPSGWATLADLGQTEFTPLYGYFVNNKTATSQVLTLNYKASTSPNERLFSRNFPAAGWYAFGPANPSYAKPQGANTVDTNNPDHILNSLLGVSSNYDSVVDFTDASFAQDPDSVSLKDPWKYVVRSADVTSTIEINSLNDLRETKGYAIYIKQSGVSLNGFQNENVSPPPATPVTTVSFNATTQPASSGSYDAGQNVTVWQNTIQIASRAGSLNSIKFSATGTVGVSDIKNFHLFLDNTDFGNPVDTVDVNGYVVFNFATPINLSVGARTLKLTADIVAGAGKTVRYGIGQASDVNVTDAVNGAVVVPTSFGIPVSQIFAGSIFINMGTLTITKAANSPSGNVNLNGSGITVARFNLSALGEPMKVENLKIGFTSNDVNITQLRNVSVFVGGVQIGSTQNVGSSTQFNFGSALLVQPGTPLTLELRSDIFDNDGINDLSSGDTLQFAILPGSSNIFRTQSLGYSSNAGMINANQLIIVAASMTLAKATAYANQTVTVPQTAFKIGEYNLTTGSTDSININQFTLSFFGATAYVQNLQDIYIVYGAKTTAIKSSVSSTSNTFAINENLAASATMNIKVYATINASVTPGSAVSTLLQVDATASSTGFALASSALGQTITVGNGKITAALDDSTPVSSLVVANTMPKVASFKFTALNDSFTILDLSATTTDSSPIIELVFKDGATELGRQPFNGNSLTKTGLNVAVPNNTSKVIDVYANLGSVGTNAGNSGANVGIALTSFKYRNSNGVETATSSFSGNGSPQSLIGNSMYIYKTKPTITNVALPTTVFSLGTQTLYQFTVTADAAGTVAWKQIKMNIASSNPSSVFTVGNFNLYDAANQATPLTSTTCPLNGTVVTCSSTQDQEVSGSKTYVLKAVISGTSIVGASVSTNIPSSGIGYAAPTPALAVSSNASFIWSDESVAGHSATTPDWMGDFLVKNLPTDSETMTK